MVLSLVARVCKLFDKVLKQLLQSFAPLKNESQLWPGGTMVGVNGGND